MSLSIAAEAINANLVGGDAVFTGVGTDTRSLQKGDLFIALRGQNFDGHNYLAEAISAGAVGAVLDHEIDTPLSYIRVPNTRRALGNLATFWRRQFKIPVIGVTGSNGKTTVKEMIGSILAAKGSGCITAGNLNNDIGTPLTLLNMQARDQFAVIEMGMNHKGEIDNLSHITQPTIALITNAAQAHLEGLGSVTDVAKAKGEIFNGMTHDGVAVINADDEHVKLWQGLVGDRRSVTFGIDNKADFTANYQMLDNGSIVNLNTPEGDIDMKVPLLGKHNVQNAVAASSAAMLAGASLKEIKSGLQSLQKISGRLEVKKGINGARILDDTYNANPDSLAVGIQVLRDYGGERVLVLGDMAELGDAGAAIHKRVGELAKRVGIARLFVIGELSKLAVKRFGKGAKYFKSHQTLIEALQDCMHADMTILVKGSRIMQMEKIVAGIEQAK